MDPLNHALIGALVSRRMKAWYALIIGSVLPDTPLFLAGALHLLRGGKLSSTYQEIMSWMWLRAADNWSHALLVIAAILCVGYLMKSRFVQALGWGWALHFVIDFFTHVDDATPPLWPFSSWVFRSPLSYWQVQHFARPFSLLSTALVFSLLFFWWVDSKKRIKTKPPE